MSDAVGLPVLEFSRLSLDANIDSSPVLPILIEIAKDGDIRNVLYATNAELFSIDLKGVDNLGRAVAEQSSAVRETAGNVRAAKALMSHTFNSITDRHPNLFAGAAAMRRADRRMRIIACLSSIDRGTKIRTGVEP